MKWNTSSFPAEGSRCVSSAKGLLRAKLLCVSLIRLEFESASPNKSEGKPAVKSRKPRSSGPISMLVAGCKEGFEESLLRIMERMAWVPQAF